MTKKSRRGSQRVMCVYMLCATQTIFEGSPMHLLHIDSSFQGERSVSRGLSARAAQRWREAHPDGTVTYRDLAETPPPHLTGFAGTDLSHELLDELKQADTIVFGLPLYNFGAPSWVKAWVDHLIVPGVAFHAETREPFLTGKDFVVTASRGGGYGAGHPARGLGSRRGVAPARHRAHRPRAALHHRGAHARAGHARDGGADPARRAEPGGRGGRDRRAVDPGADGRVRQSAGGGSGRPGRCGAARPERRARVPAFPRRGVDGPGRPRADRR